jgi:hypothetical protein
MTRHSLRLTAIAAVTALAGFSAQGIEATQWNPQADRSAASPNEARMQSAWATDLGEATQFHDGKTRDAMLTRAEVRNDYKMARQRGLLNDTGEGGATDRVLASREAFVREEHERLVALNTPAPDEDPIADMIAAMTPDDNWYSESFASMSSTEFLPDDVLLRLPTDQQDPAAYSYVGDPRLVALAPSGDGYMIVETER